MSTNMHQISVAKPQAQLSKIPKVYQCINRVQAELAKQGIAKKQRNTQQNYNFRGIDDLYNALGSILASNGLCILPRTIAREVTERETKSGSTLFSVLLTVDLDLVCAEDASMHTLRMFGEAMDSGDKATNKASTAAYKYACLQAFCIPVEGDDPDSDSSTFNNIKPYDTKTINREINPQELHLLQIKIEQAAADEKNICKALKIDCIESMKADKWSTIIRKLDTQIANRHKASGVEANKVIPKPSEVDPVVKAYFDEEK